jgi:hypothetical protein
LARLDARVGLGRRRRPGPDVEGEGREVFLLRRVPVFTR